MTVSWNMSGQAVGKSQGLHLLSLAMTEGPSNTIWEQFGEEGILLVVDWNAGQAARDGHDFQYVPLDREYACIYSLRRFASVCNLRNCRGDKLKPHLSTEKNRSRVWCGEISDVEVINALLLSTKIASLDGMSELRSGIFSFVDAYDGRAKWLNGRFKQYGYTQEERCFFPPFFSSRSIGESTSSPPREPCNDSTPSWPVEPLSKVGKAKPPVRRRLKARHVGCSPEQRSTRRHSLSSLTRATGDRPEKGGAL